MSNHLHICSYNNVRYVMKDIIAIESSTSPAHQISFTYMYLHICYNVFLSTSFHLKQLVQRKWRQPVASVIKHEILRRICLHTTYIQPWQRANLQRTSSIVVGFARKQIMHMQHACMMWDALIQQNNSGPTSQQDRGTCPGQSLVSLMKLPCLGGRQGHA